MCFSFRFFPCTNSFCHHHVLMPIWTTFLVEMVSQPLPLFGSWGGNVWWCSCWAWIHFEDMIPHRNLSHPKMFWWQHASWTASMIQNGNWNLWDELLTGNLSSLHNASSQQARMIGEVYTVVHNCLRHLVRREMHSFTASGWGHRSTWSDVSSVNGLSQTGQHGDGVHCCLWRNAFVGSHLWVRFELIAHWFIFMFRHHRF